MEGAGQPLSELLNQLVGPGLGIEIVSKVNDIPKGSRLAVSTSLLACLIAVCMRATGQSESLTGKLRENERRLVAARAILGEWLAGSGGGWQDSGGVWPGMKLIFGELAGPGDPEYKTSRGRLLPRELDDGESPIQLDVILEELGFERELHEQIRAGLRSGRIGLAKNRLPENSQIEDVA